MRDSIKAPLVLMLISAGICGLLALANDLTDEKIQETEAKALQESLTAAFGEGEYTALSQQYEGINQVIRDTKDRLIFDITATGYETDGQHLLVGIAADGTVCGISVVTISDSPTQAARVQEEAFLSQFVGQSDPAFSYDAVAGATKSSEGIRSAVTLALETYLTHKEAMYDGE